MPSDRNKTYRCMLSCYSTSPLQQTYVVQPQRQMAAPENADSSLSLLRPLGGVKTRREQTNLIDSVSRQRATLLHFLLNLMFKTVFYTLSSMASKTHSSRCCKTYRCIIRISEREKEIVQEIMQRLFEPMHYCVELKEKKKTNILVTLFFFLGQQYEDMN